MNRAWHGSYVLLSLVLALAAMHASGWGAENDAESLEAAEARVLAIEETAASQGEGDSLALTGVARMQPPPDVSEDVVGWFKERNGAVHLLKLADPSVGERLKKSEGRTITVIGRLRVNGKYFVASRLQTIAAPEPYAGRRRGL